MSVRWWFLGTRPEREPIRMEDVDLQNRIFRDHRMPIHEARTEAEKDSIVVRERL